MKVTTHLIRYSIPYCDGPGRENHGYCGEKTRHTMYPPAFSVRYQNVDCQECLDKYAMEQLANA